MPNKKEKTAKEKRQERKELQKKLKIAQEKVDLANKLEDPLEPFPAFRKFSTNGLVIHLSTKRVTNLDESVKNWVFDLTRRNMRDRYVRSDWDWNEKKKREEMMDDRAWYLLATTDTQNLVGFSHFRFDIDEEFEVLYCYELQLESKYRRKGIGKFMMQILELLAFSNNMKKVVLTVLKDNPYSEFFKRLNYKIDESSPRDKILATYSYEILSKINKKLSAESNTNE